METNNKPDLVRSVVSGFHTDAVPEERWLRPPPLHHPGGSPGSALQPPSPPVLSPPLLPLPWKGICLGKATSVLLARLGNVHLYGNTRQMNDHVLVVLHKDAKQM